MGAVGVLGGIREIVCAYRGEHDLTTYAFRLLGSRSAMLDLHRALGH